MKGASWKSYVQETSPHGGPRTAKEQGTAGQGVKPTRKRGEIDTGMDLEDEA